MTLYSTKTNFRWSCAVWVLICVSTTGMGKIASAEPVAVNNGDRIVFIGSTFIERDVSYGCLETLLTAHFPEYDLTFRNLGWSGDDVFGIARASFDSTAKGYERLLNQAKEAQPNLILFNYGLNESFEGPSGLQAFIDGYNKLIDDVKSTNASIALISPTFQENLGAPFPDPKANNENIRLYTKAIAKIAKERDFRFVDMTVLLPVNEGVTSSPLTDNGVHFTEAGYWKVAPIVLGGLGFNVGNLDSEKLQPLREVILEKNRLFFNKWRPQNATYITGFREHEQGRHVAEFPMFDPLVAEQEASIAKIRLVVTSKESKN